MSAHFDPTPELAGARRDGHRFNAMRLRPAHWAVALGALLQLTSPRAAADPMRPLLSPTAAAASASAVASRSLPSVGTGTAATTVDAAAPATLLAIRQDSAGRWQALFGDRWLAVGDRLDGASVSAIDGNTVRLGRGASARTWHLLPALQAAGADAPGAATRTTNAEANTPATAAATTAAPPPPTTLAGSRSNPTRAPQTGTP